MQSAQRVYRLIHICSYLAWIYFSANSVFSVLSQSADSVKSGLSVAVAVLFI